MYSYNGYPVIYAENRASQVSLHTIRDTPLSRSSQPRTTPFVLFYWRVLCRQLQGREGERIPQPSRGS